MKVVATSQKRNGDMAEALVELTSLRRALIRHWNLSEVRRMLRHLKSDGLVWIKGNIILTLR